MEFVEYLKIYNAQEKINKLAKRYKNKKVALYGAGQFAQCIFQNCDLSKLNIIAIADKRFENINQKHNFFGLNCIKPNDLKTMDFDVIFITNFDVERFIEILDESVLYGTKNANVEIRPLINLNFKDIFLNNIKEQK